MQREEKCCLLLQTSFPLKSLVRIKLTCVGQETVRKEKLCSSLNEQQLGGVVVTVLDNSTSLCFAICHKAYVGRIFKALHAQQRALGFRLGDVKSSILMTPMTAEELSQCLRQAVMTHLQRSGWWLLGEGQLLGSNFLQAAAGEVVHCHRVSAIQIVPQPPDKFYVLLDPGTVRYRVLQLPWRTTADTNATSRQKRPSVKVPCCILPSMRAAWAARVCSLEEISALPVLEEAAELCAAGLGASWREKTSFLELAMWQDDDSPLVAYPACAVWSVNGLSTLPTKRGSLAAIMERIAGELSGSEWEFWGATPLVIQHNGTCTLNGQQGAEQKPLWEAASKFAVQPAPKQTRQQAVMKAAGNHAQIQLSSGMTGSLRRGFAEALREALPSPELQDLLQKLQAEAAEEGQKNFKGAARGHQKQATAGAPPTHQTTEQRAGEPADTPCNGEAEAPRARAAPKVPILLFRKKPSIGIKPPAGKGAGGKATAAGGALKERARKAAVKKAVEGQVDNSAVEANHQTADRGTAEEPAPDQPAAAALQQRGTAQGTKRKAAQLLREDKPAENKNAAKAAESPVDGQAKAAPRKRTKAGDLAPQDVEAKVARLHKEGNLLMLTIPEMKCFLKTKTLPVGGKKADLIARLTESIQKAA